MKTIPKFPRHRSIKQKSLPQICLTGAHSGNSKFVYVAASISALGGLLFGYDTGVISGAILFVKQEYVLSVTMEEMTVSAALLGALAGAVCGGILADRFGRRRVLVLIAAVYSVAAAGTVLSPGFAWLIACRILAGTAIGTASFIAPLYISEVSLPSIRGRLVSLNQIGLTGGILVSYLMDYSLSGLGAWRWMFGLAAFPAVALGIGMLSMPESPRWLLSHNLADQALAALKRIRGNVDVEGELQDIQKSLGLNAGRWTELASPQVRPALLVGVGLAIFQQVTGINTVIYYAPTIFQLAGFGTASGAILAAVGVGAVNVLVTIVAMQLLDRIGRRTLLLGGLIGMAVSLGLLGLAFSRPNHTGSLAWISVTSLMLYVGSFGIGLGPIFWLLISEIYPLQIRGLAMSIATVANWGANLLVALSFLSLIQILKPSGTFWFYSLLGLGALIFAYLFVPETKGQSLEQIEAFWRAGKHNRKINLAQSKGKYGKLK